jgi:2-polyprenyl-3-methyl-5-hydroxy-6-metoxy-1,4-benzoquinol methylase
VAQPPGRERREQYFRIVAPMPNLQQTPALGPAYSIGAARMLSLVPEQQQTRAAILRLDRAEDYESVPCSCGAVDRDLVIAEIDRHGLPCRNVICQACGLIRLSPRWREDRYRRFYENEYRRLYQRSTTAKLEYARELAGSRPLADRAGWVVQAQARHSSSTAVSILEIGAGGGWNLAGLPPEWNKVGYDVDEEYLEVGRAEFGLTMQRGLVDEALDQVARADVVLLSHVVEHLSDPEGTLAALARRMRPEALLLLEVPGIFRIHRSNLDPLSYLQNAHTYTFCATTLHQACIRSGLEVVEIDEFTRAVCRVATGAEQRVALGSAGLAQRILRYLRRCDFGYRQYRRLARAPVVGRYLAYGWKMTYFAALGPATGGNLRLRHTDRR